MSFIKKLILVTLIILVFSIISVNSQEVKTEGQVPIDANVKIGKLDNGLTYYIRKNEFPKDRAEFFLTVNAGAILEDDDQDGLAHFCEHMAFNGTKNFEKHDIIHYLQSIGMKFGPEINAFTSHDVTNYMLNKVPTDVPENIDTALMILYDWANNLSFEEEEIDNERGVIHEEWRTRRGAQFRLKTKTDKTLFKGSKYAKRDVIGDIDVIDNCKYETLRRFYNEWYRPELQAIIAIGDFDIEKMERKITELFEKMPVKEDARERKYFPVPDHEESFVAVETDEEARYSTVQVYYKHDAVTKEEKGDLSYLRTSLMHQLYYNMFKDRMQELLRSENPPFIYAYTNYSNIARTKAAYMTFALAKNNQVENTLETIIKENKRIEKHGFTETEIERAKKKLLKDILKEYNERNKKESMKYAWDYFSNFLENKPVTGIEFYYAFAKEVVPGISIEELNELAPKWITDKNMVAIVTAPEKEGINVPTEEKVKEIIEKTKRNEVEAYTDTDVAKDLIDKKPAPAPVKEVVKNEALDFEEWTLENGAKVIAKNTAFKDDEILFTAFSEGGFSLYPPEKITSAKLASTIINQSGLNDMDMNELQKFLSDKDAEVHAWINELQEGLRGQSSVKDFETMLKMTYLYFTDTREDSTAYQSYLTRIMGFIENKGLDPRSALMDTIMLTMTQNSPYHKPFTKKRLQEAKFDEVHQIYNERLSNAADFTFIFVGNIDKEKHKPLIETYIGGIPSKQVNEKWKDLNVRPPEGVVEKTFYRNMKVPKATVFVSFADEYEQTPENKIALSALNDILDVRYTETIREEQGGTYGVRINTSQEKYPVENYQTNIYFDCAPENAEKLSGIVFEEIKKIQEDGPLAKDLKNFKENKLKKRKENLEKNKFWRSLIKKKYYYHADDEIVTEYENLVKGVTAEDVKEAAKKYLSNDHYVKIVMYPETFKE